MAGAAAVIISSDEMLPSFASEKGVLGLSSDAAELGVGGRTDEARAAASTPQLNIIFIVLER